MLNVSKYSKKEKIKPMLRKLPSKLTEKKEIIFVSTLIIKIIIV